MLAEFDWSRVLTAEVAVPLGALFVGLVAIVCTVLRQIAVHRIDVDLKRDLAARGFSVDEIERIVRAKSEPEKSEGRKNREERIKASDSTS